MQETSPQSSSWGRGDSESEVSCRPMTSGGGGFRKSLKDLSFGTTLRRMSPCKEDRFHVTSRSPNSTRGEVAFRRHGSKIDVAMPHLITPLSQVTNRPLLVPR